MANVYVNLPAAAANGPGAWVDVSAMGAEKSIIIGGTLIGTVNIEISNEAVATAGVPVASLRNKGNVCLMAAALWMRAVVVGYQQGGAPDVEVGANDDGATGINLPVTAGDGVGAAQSVAAMGDYKTVTVQGTYRGSVLVEQSNDNVSWAPAFISFLAPGSYSSHCPAQFMRVRRSGVPSALPGTPIVDIAGINDTAAGPGFQEPLAFTYTVTGLEADLSDFFVPFAAPRADDDYLVFASLQDVANQVTLDFPDAVAGDRTVAQFRLVASADLTAGDIIQFIVVNP